MPKHARVTRPTDLRAPGAIEQMLAFHRQHFGNARMSNDDGALGTPPPADPPAGDPQPAAPATPPAPAADPAPAEWDGKVESLPESVQKMIRDLRTESAERRTKLTTAERAQQDAIRALAKAAGIEIPGGEEAPDPKQLAQQLTESQRDGRETKVELAVFKAAVTAGADPVGLTDSRSFMQKVATLDPAADDFAAKVDDAVKKAVADNPKLKAARAAGASGADHAGGSGEGAAKPTTLDDAIAQKMAR